MQICMQLHQASVEMVTSLVSTVTEQRTIHPGALSWIGLNPTGIVLAHLPFTPCLDQGAMVVLLGDAEPIMHMEVQLST